MCDLLQRLADPAPIAWTLGAAVPLSSGLPHGRYAKVRLGRRVLLFGRSHDAGLLHLNVAHDRSRRRWRRLLTLQGSHALASLGPEAALAHLEAERQAGRAPDALARHALLLDVARLLLHARGHAQGELSGEGGLDGVEAEADPATLSVRLRRRIPLPHVLPQALLRDVLGRVLLVSDGELRLGIVCRHLLQAPASAHASLDLARSVGARVQALPTAWQARFAEVLTA